VFDEIVERENRGGVWTEKKVLGNELVNNIY